jgi:hypothetical protein
LIGQRPQREEIGKYQPLHTHLLKVLPRSGLRKARRGTGFSASCAYPHIKCSTKADG